MRHLKTGFWPARRITSLEDLDEQYVDWRDRVCNRRRHATCRFLVADRFSEERRALRVLPPARFDYALTGSSVGSIAFTKATRSSTTTILQ